MSMTVVPSSRSSSTRVASPAAKGAETSSAISRSQRCRQVARLRKAGAIASITCSRAVSVSQCKPRGSLDAVGFVDREGERQSVDRVAPFGGDTGAAFHDDAADIVFRHRAAADRPLHVEQPAFRLAAGEVDVDGAKPRIGHVLGLADGGADRALSLVEIGDAAAANAAPLLPAEAQDAQCAVGFGAADQAGDLGRCRYPARRIAPCAVCAVGPMARSRRVAGCVGTYRSRLCPTHDRASCCVAGVLSLAIIPDGRRSRRRRIGTHDNAVRQAHVDDLQRTIEQRHRVLQRAKPAKRLVLVLAPAASRRTVLASRRFQRRSSDAHGGDHAAGDVGARCHFVEQTRRSRRARRRRPRAAATIRVRCGPHPCHDHHCASRDRCSTEPAVILPDGEGRALREPHQQRAGQTALDRGVLHPAECLTRLRTAATEKPRIGVAGR